MAKVKKEKTVLEKTLTRANIIGFTGIAISAMMAIATLISPDKNYPALGTVFILIAFALVPYLAIISSARNLENAGQANLNTLVFSVLSVNLLYSGVVLALALTNQLVAATALLILFGPFIYMGLRIIFSVKNNIIIGEGSNPLLKKIWISAAISFVISIAIGMLL